MIFDKFQAAFDSCGLFDLEWICVYIIQFLCTAGEKKSQNYFAAEKKNLHIFINLPEFSAVPIGIFSKAQILVEDKWIRIVRT